MKSKLIHLPEKVIEILTIEAVKKKTDFKNYSQDFLIKKADQIDKRNN